MTVPVGTVISLSQARQTGATITVERTGPGSWIEQEEGWMTLCVNHGSCCLHYTREDALGQAVYPAGWCGDCDEIAQGRKPRITRRLP